MVNIQNDLKLYANTSDDSGHNISKNSYKQVLKGLVFSLATILYFLWENLETAMLIKFNVQGV